MYLNLGLTAKEVAKLVDADYTTVLDVEKKFVKGRAPFAWKLRKLLLNVGVSSKKVTRAMLFYMDDHAKYDESFARLEDMLRAVGVKERQAQFVSREFSRTTKTLR